MNAAALPAKDERLALVDFSRGIAAVMVVALHATDIVSQPKYFGVDPVHGLFASGARGVDYFFVLSGFIIAYIHWQDLGRPERLPAYAWKRFIRVYLPLWVVAFPFLISGIVMNADSMPKDGTGRMQALVGSLALLPTHERPLPAVVWTLKHEILFYGAFAVLIWRPRWGAAVMALGGGLCLYHGTIGFTPNFLVDFFCNVYNLEFLLGIGCGLLARWYCIPWPRTLLAIGVVLFLASAAPYHEVCSPLPWITNPSTLWQVAQFGISSAFIVLGLVQIDRTYQSKISRRLAVLGAASYAIYLVHLPVLCIGVKVCKAASMHLPLPPVVVMCGLFVAGVAAGIVLHLLVERPLIRSARDFSFDRLWQSVGPMRELPAQLRRVTHLW